MKKYYLDTNILLDFLGNRAPFGKLAFQIFQRAELRTWELWTSANSVLTTYYLLEKAIGTKEAKRKIGQLLSFLEIQPMQKNSLEMALLSSFKDLEDGAQHYCAASIPEIAGIITRNKRDFKSSDIPVFGPEEALVE